MTSSTPSDLVELSYGCPEGRTLHEPAVVPMQFFYRYTSRSSGGGLDDYGRYSTRETRLVCEIWHAVKKTPKGVWIEKGEHLRGQDAVRYVGDCGPRFVNLSARKRLAYETKELALKSFLERKRHHVGHIERQMSDICKAQLLAGAELKKLTGGEA